MTEFTFRGPNHDHTVRPLENGEPVDEFYGDSNSLSSTRIEEEDASVVFLYRDPDGTLSLVFMHDIPRDGSGGAASMEFTLGDSVGDAEWSLQDDGGDFSSTTDRSPDWAWNDRNKDGGVLQGGFDEDFELTVEASFNDEANRQPLTPGRIDRWQVLDGGQGNDAQSPERKTLEERTTISSGGAERTEVCGSATTLQFIPGEIENVSQGGHPLNSSLMQMWFEDDTLSVDQLISVEVPVDPVLDSWLKGDMSDTIPSDLESALAQEVNKYEDEFPDEAFNQYRLDNGVSICFEVTEDGGVDEDSVEIEFAEAGVEPSDPKISLGGRERSYTVTPDHSVNGIPVEDWFGTFRQRSNRRKRYFTYDTSFEFDGVEGVRVTTVAGGYAGFVKDLSERVGNDTPGFLGTVWDSAVSEWALKLLLAVGPPGVQVLVDYLVVIPNTYTFLDFILLADGRRYVRVWDASQYPSLATYVDGERQSFEQMPYEPRQLFNLRVLAFLVLATAGVTPFTSPLSFYERVIDEPELIEEEVEDALDEFPPPVGFGVSDVLPTVPRATHGLDENLEPLDDPDAPFGSVAGLLYPVSGEVEPE